MKTIRHTKTLFYFDGPQVIEANDNDGQKYIGNPLFPALRSSPTAVSRASRKKQILSSSYSLIHS